MIVDSSAIVAILLAEPERDAMVDALLDSDRTLMSAATYVEAAIVIDSARDPRLSRKLDGLLVHFGIEVVAVDRERARVARDAYRDFGRGSGHPARLNYGDCFSYALATQQSDTLLFKGDDFPHTDVRPAL